MSDSNTDALKRAYELVEAGQPEEARSILDALLAADPRNPDAWWIYAYAVDDPAEAQRALKTVLQLDPDYPEATTLLTSLQDQYPQLVEAEAVAALAEGHTPPLPSELPAGEDESELDSGEEPEFLPPPPTAIPEPPTMRVKKEKRSNWPIIIALVAAFILILLAALLLRPTEPTTTTAGLATATLSSVVDETTAGTEVTLEVSPLAVIDNGSGTQVSVLGLTPFATGNFPTEVNSIPEATTSGEQATTGAGESGAETVLPPTAESGTTGSETGQPTAEGGNTVVLEVTPLDATSAEQTTVAGGTGDAGTETALVPTAETGTVGSEAGQPTVEGGNTVILEVTPLDATSAEQTTAASGFTSLEQEAEAATATSEAATLETVTGGEADATAASEVTPIDVTPTTEQTTAETEVAATTEGAGEIVSTPSDETGTNGEIDATTLASTNEAGQTTDANETATPEPDSEVSPETTPETGTAGEPESTAIGAGGDGATSEATADIEETQTSLNPEVTSESSQQTEVTAEAGIGEGTIAPESEATVSTGATPTAESFVVEATLSESPEATSLPEATEADATAEPGQGTGAEATGLQALEQSLTDAGITNYAITGLVTDLGNGLVVTVCAEEGPALRATLIPVMNIVAQNAPSQDARFTAVGTEIISCSNPTTTLRLIAVPRPVAEDYANGNLTNEEFEAVWRSL